MKAPPHPPVATSPLEELSARIASNPTIRGVFSDLSRHIRVPHPGIVAGSAKALLIAGLSRALETPLVVVTSTAARARWILDDLRVAECRQPLFEFPDSEVLPYEESSPDSDVTSQRMAALAAIRSGLPCIVVTTATSLLCYVPRPAEAPAAAGPLVEGAQVGFTLVVHALLQSGFTRTALVEEMGQFSVRGGIIDVFPPGVEDPLRIEFDGDTVASLRSFSSQTQRSIEVVHRVDLVPRDELVSVNPASWDHDPEPPFLRRARELGVSEEQVDRMLLVLQQDPLHPCRRWLYPLFGIEPVSFLDLLPRGTLCIVDDFDGATGELDRAHAEVHEQHARRLKLGTLLPVLAPDVLFSEPARLAARFAAEASLIFRFVDDEGPLRIQHAEAIGGSIPVLKERLEALTRDGYDIWVSCENEGQRERLEELVGSPAHVRIWAGGLRHGFLWAEERIALFTDQDIFERYARRRRTRRHHAGFSPSRVLELNPGDIVVHAFHGVGRFEGLARITVMNREQEVLTLSYRGGDRLHVPVEQSNLVDRYLGPDARAPALDSLGGVRWKHTKTRVRKAVQDLAQDLLRLYAARQAVPGFAFPEGSHWEDEVAASFPFQETPDQLTAWSEINADMASPRPMDRLICGDVGYGKTELAVRAAFKAVLAGKQVAVLVPTTILAEQHLNTFRERLAEYPVQIEMLSRFRSRQEQKEVVRRLAEGSMDIVIGTHRLLQRDIGFKDLGLVVIDEEQRFGVAHKERLKQLRTQVEVLTMTATPIPRTLYLALAGARDMSVVNTPPQGRVPHKTIVSAFDEGLIIEGILRELGRGGQVYFVHNRVESILAMTALLRKLLPQVRFEIAHGQMSERTLEDVMHAFIGRKIDVLVCTMIIESGLDIPGVDTIMINRADRFGLAQLYQLRGRVGRGTRQAYAYLMVPPFRTLTPQARRRLEAMKQFSELGSGLRLSLLDLEIRGVGNILGRDQHGHVAEVGFHLYCSMLEEEVRRLKGEEIPPRYELTVQTVPPVALPESYVPDETMRLEIYRRLGRADSAEAVRGVREELIDRFGGCPGQVERLLKAVRLKILLQAHPIQSVQWSEGDLAIVLDPAATPPALLVHAAASCGGIWRTDRRGATALHCSLGRPTPSGAELDPVLDALEKGA
ncbi:MAG: transcription-repair coupling factor [Candidatus Eisenbacteria bacterium]|nr:transcription-repair coupling factor [Candidatus Eisenbacteria bacterium]